MHYNARANGTMILTAMFNSPGVKGLQILQFNPYNSTERVAMVECAPHTHLPVQYCNILCMYDGTYYNDLTYISNLPEGIPAALQQQTTHLSGDYFYSMLSYDPSKGNSVDATVDATYINMCCPYP